MDKIQQSSPDVNLNFDQLRPKARALVEQVLRVAPDPISLEELSRLVWQVELDEWQTNVIYVTASHARAALPSRRWIVGGEPPYTLRWAGPVVAAREERAA